MVIELTLHSSELRQDTHVNILIPKIDLQVDKQYKTLWLLHGLNGDNTSWTRLSSIERYARERELIVIMPSVDRSWYTNTAYNVNYFNYVTKELPEICSHLFKGISTKREDNIVGGLSMGGYGALKIALTYPERYGACISLSGSLDITRKGRKYDLEEWRSIFGFQIESALDLEGSEHDLFALAERNKNEGSPFPKIYMWCGLQDTLIEANHAFDNHLTALGVEHTFEESEGDHSWKWWDLHIQSAMRNIFDN